MCWLSRSSSIILGVDKGELFWAGEGTVQSPDILSGLTGSISLPLPIARRIYIHCGIKGAFGGGKAFWLSENSMVRVAVATDTASAQSKLIVKKVLSPCLCI